MTMSTLILMLLATRSMHTLNPIYILTVTLMHPRIPTPISLLTHYPMAIQMKIEREILEQTYIHMKEGHGEMLVLE